ncbi:hypothetical protein HK098_004681 [Nowakowskiella sp. JEL0407]|nr:hypothetical protein HK098_004681 [Nowakowskiella sp. JEL0407]
MKGLLGKTVVVDAGRGRSWIFVISLTLGTALIVGWALLTTCSYTHDSHEFFCKTLEIPKGQPLRICDTEVAGSCHPTEYSALTRFSYTGETLTNCTGNIDQIMVTMIEKYYGRIIVNGNLTCNNELGLKFGEVSTSKCPIGDIVISQLNNVPGLWTNSTAGTSFWIINLESNGKVSFQTSSPNDSAAAYPFFNNNPKFLQTMSQEISKKINGTRISAAFECTNCFNKKSDFFPSQVTKFLTTVFSFVGTLYAALVYLCTWGIDANVSKLPKNEVDSVVLSKNIPAD